MKLSFGKIFVIAAIVIAVLFIGAQIDPVADLMRTGFDLLVPPVVAG